MKETYIVSVNEKEQRLLELIKSIEFGQMNISIADYQPIIVKECIVSVKL